MISPLIKVGNISKGNIFKEICNALRHKTFEYVLFRCLTRQKLKTMKNDRKHCKTGSIICNTRNSGDTDLNQFQVKLNSSVGRRKAERIIKKILS